MGGTARQPQIGFQNCWSFQGLERRCRALVRGTASGDLPLATTFSGQDMITNWPRTATWTWKQKVNINLRQQTDDKDTRQWTNDKFGLDCQLPDNDKNRLDQKHMTTDFDSGHKTKNNSRTFERNEEKFFDNIHDKNMTKDTKMRFILKMN
eukprot:TRINITY_DN3907_c0_g1_i3.p2 TRINITY_DN3907_c0_g1~~TRINITY_DN3907_c0_g1_i3.p2  ORF type:complete len:159 (+),score=34.01 TRINITY_DN3907_c0_g1_i3:25-477(+)